MLPVFQWEQNLQQWMARVSHPLLTPLVVANILLADEVIIFLAIPVLAWFVPPLAVGTIALALLMSSTRIEDALKNLIKRGRPRDPREWGIPSGDCVVVPVWTIPLLGVWAILPILLVAWARVARGAHWPLDTLAGVLVGLWFLLPWALWSGRLSWYAQNRETLERLHVFLGVPL